MALTLPTKPVKYRGVAWHPGHQKYVAKTHAQGRYVTLGYYDSAEDAARVFDVASHFLRGPNANLNFADCLPPPNMTTAEVYDMLWARGLVSIQDCYAI